MLCSVGLENGAKGLKLETMGAWAVPDSPRHQIDGQPCLICLHAVSLGVNALGSKMSEDHPAIPGAPRYLPITA